MSIVGWIWVLNLPPGQLGSDNTGVNQAVDLVAWMVKNLPAVQETWV